MSRRGGMPALAAMALLALTACGPLGGATGPRQAAVTATASQPAPPTATTTASLCRPPLVFGQDLRIAAGAALPVAATQLAWMNPGSAASRGALTQALGVAPSERGIIAWVKPVAGGAADLTTGPRQGTGTWAFHLGPSQVTLTVTDAKLAGPALRRAQTFGPAWSGGLVQYRIVYPRDGLPATPDLAAYTARLAASAAAGRATLTVTTATVSGPGPSAFRFDAAAFDFGAFAQAYLGSSYDLCDAWHTAALPDEQGGRLTQVTASVLAVGGGDRVGFGGGRFVIERVQTGVDRITWYAVPGLLPLPKTP